MEVPQKLQFKQDFKNESKVFAQFTTNDFPEFIRVKGTDDFTKVKKNKKEWFSKCKYPSLAITLQLFKNNEIVAEPTYKADGNIFTPPPSNICEVIGFDARIADNNNVVIEWQSVLETNVSNYLLFRQTNPEIGFDIVDSNILAQGNGKNYSIVDGAEFERDLAIYVLVVRFSDQSGQLLASNPVFEDNFA